MVVLSQSDRESLKSALHSRAGKKLKMSVRGHFEGSEMSSKERDFLTKGNPKNMHQYTVLLIIDRPINRTRYLDPYSSILILFLIRDPQYCIVDPQFFLQN